MRALSTILNLLFLIDVGFSSALFLRAITDPQPLGSNANIERFAGASAGFLLAIILLLLSCTF